MVCTLLQNRVFFRASRVNSVQNHLLTILPFAAIGCVLQPWPQRTYDFPQVESLLVLIENYIFGNFT